MIENQTTDLVANPEQLYREIRELFEQYKLEVPKKRRPWPVSIQARVMALWKLGISSHTIAEETTLPAQTMYSWRQRIKKDQPGFLPATIVQKRRRRLNSQGVQLSQLESRPMTVTVVVGNGIRLEGVPVDRVAQIVREISEALR
jgi:hypothetical protein